MTIDTSAIRTRVQQEIELVPEDKLADLYNCIHYFRLGIELSSGDARQTLRFAGSWRDMPDEDFDDFMREIAERRR